MTSNPTGKNEVGFRLAGSYTWNQFRFVGLCEKLTDVDGVSGSDYSSWGPGAAYTMGKNCFKAQYYGTDGLSTTSDCASMISIGYEYNMTEAMKFYVVYGMADNDTAANKGMSAHGRGDNSGVPAVGDDPSGISFGVVLKF